MAYSRQQMVNLALSYKGVVRGSAKHKDLINTFNKVRPHGERMTYTAAWCAAGATAWLIKGGYTTKNMPMSYSCAQLIRDSQKLGYWVESDAWRGGEPGDLIIYYWSAPKSGDCKKYTSHVGMIYKRTGTGYEVIECNKHNKVASRTVPFDWRYIRGFCHLKYDNEKPEPKIGELVVDGIFGKKSITRAQQYFGTTDDGYISGQQKKYRTFYKGIVASRIRYESGGSALVKAIQKTCGIKQTGVIDQATVKALQTYLNKAGATLKVDGKWGKKTSEAFQTFLNSKVK